ncbi:16S rRNA (cytidine(1402)-2'-O)-methyltransferase [Salininema proteolyticum]|uniref:Ribosomal RNA small subunit methyltransferase I n=1 Tax=Salininema proteolyticum TaxID=1607685 RepID=A0ABV8TYE6_9ACTN
MSRCEYGRLILLGAPLGNPGDASPRLKEALSSADVIAAEDTRRLKRLLGEIGVNSEASLVSYFEGNESAKTAGLVERLVGGEDVAVITDGGMPSVSDPGFRLVRAAIEAGVAITSVPGPSAPTTALALSGLPSDRFSFEGFPPRKGGELRRTLDERKDDGRTAVYFESPRRVEATLVAMAEVFGADRPAALCRELTKTYEEVRRGTLGELLEGVRADAPRGEITLVVAGSTGPDASEATPERLADEVAELEGRGTPRKEAMKQVAKRYGLSKRDVYDALLDR